MATSRINVFSHVLCACLIIASVHDVTSVPEGGEHTAFRSDYMERGEEFGSHTTKTHSNSLLNKIQRSMGGFKDTQTEDDDDIPYSIQAHAPMTYRLTKLLHQKSSAGGSRVDKRDFQASSRMRTLLRIEAPCAGGNEHFTIGAAPTAATINVSPRDLLVALGGEAMRAQKVALHILRRYEAMGMDRVTVSLLGNEPGFGFGIRGRTAITTQGLRQNTAVVLNDIYRQLARAALYLEAIVDGRGSRFVPLIESLKENGVYNLLCGVKVVMDYKDSAFLQSGSAMLANANLMDAPSVALRLAQNYIIIREVAELLADTGARLTVLSQYY